MVALLPSKNSVSIFPYRWFIFTHSFAHAVISFMWNHKTLESEQKNTMLHRKSQEKGFGVELTTLTYTEAVWNEALPVSMSIKPSLQLVSHVRMESIKLLGVLLSWDKFRALPWASSCALIDGRGGRTRMAKGLPCSSWCDPSGSCLKDSPEKERGRE